MNANKEQQGCEDSRDFHAEISTPCSDAIDPRTEPDVVAITYSRQLASIRGSEQYSFVSIVVAQVPGFPHSLCRAGKSDTVRTTPERRPISASTLLLSTRRKFDRLPLLEYLPQINLLLEPEEKSRAHLRLRCNTFRR